jgi:hypothetical protein
MISNTHVSEVSGEERRLCSSDCFVGSRDFECELMRNKSNHLRRCQRLKIGSSDDDTYLPRNYYPITRHWKGAVLS